MERIKLEEYSKEHDSILKGDSTKIAEKIRHAARVFIKHGKD